MGVGRMLGIMEVMAERIRVGGSPDSGALDQMLEFLRVFVDRCHHTKEEQLLFPALRTANVVGVEETLEILTADHTHGREIVARIAAAVDRLSGSGGPESAELVEAMTEYARLLHAHIRGEENDCFSMADRELPTSVQNALNEGYERIERDVVGEGRHEAFHALLDRLSLDYDG